MVSAFVAEKKGLAFITRISNLIITHPFSSLSYNVSSGAEDIVRHFMVVVARDPYCVF